MNGISSRLREYECLKDLGGCGAQPGENCVTRSGRKTAEVHAARWDQSHADLPPGIAKASEVLSELRDWLAIKDRSGGFITPGEVLARIADLERER